LIEPQKQEATMAGKAKPIPEGYHTATPYLIIIATHTEDVSPEEIGRRAVAQGH
jgi:hypothetical protein